MRHIAITLTTTVCLAWSSAVTRADETDLARRVAAANAKVRRAELDKAIEANRKAAGSITEVEIERLRAVYELAALEPDAPAEKRPAAEAAVAKLELQKALEANRQTAGAVAEAEIELLRRKYELASLGVDAHGARRADASAKVSQALIQKALDANRKSPGAISEQEIDRLRLQHQASVVESLQAQVKSLRGEVEQLRKTVQDLQGTE
jgi:hypothetical protein